MKKLFAVLTVAMMVILASGSMTSFAGEKDFKLYFKDLSVDAAASSYAGAGPFNTTPSNGDTELTFLNFGNPTGSNVGGSYYLEGSANRYITYSFNTDTAGVYEMSLSFLADWNTGIYQVVIDGVSIGLPVNTHHSANSVPTWSFVTADIGKVALAAGSHTLRVICLGMAQSHDYSIGYLYSLDFSYRGDYEAVSVLKYDIEDQTLTFHDQQSGGNMSHESFAGTVYQMDMKTHISYTFDITLERGGKYLLDIGYLADWNCVVVNVAVDNNIIGDANTYKVVGSGWGLCQQAIAELQLSAGKHAITLSYNAEATSLNTQHPQEELYNSYIDYVALQAIELDEVETIPQTGDGYFGLFGFASGIMAVAVCVKKKKFA